jgi:hypothetical protein
MKRRVKRIFQAFFIDESKEDDLLFVVDEDCNREVEFKKAYTEIYGTEYEDAEILQISPVSCLYRNGVEKEYRIQLAGK